jgi:hypothetical protein
VGCRRAFRSIRTTRTGTKGYTGERFIKAAEWRVHNGIERYHAKSNAPEESSSERWYPVEFNFEHLCWVEIRWIENLEIGGTWEAFRIAGEDLGLDITPQDAADQDQIGSS